MPHADAGSPATPRQDDLPEPPQAACPDERSATADGWSDDTPMSEMTGSGKSSGPGETLLRALARHSNRSHLCLAAKPEDHDTVIDLFRRLRPDQAVGE